ncbi:UDP-glucose 4-epimerase-like isoform X1 [Sycon ciliatum]|uniref:UDP-glucose 4-epimerase-like isoform X1 n=1 Tax=Sycon ciliatum TaxID=27933 RepID=UPI0031F6D4F3
MASTTRHVLVTGGAGYIGSHTLVELLAVSQSGPIKYVPVILDNLSNSCEGNDEAARIPESVKRVGELASWDPIFHQVDLCDIDAVRQVFSKYPFHSVIHFAGLKAVGESVAKPLRYYQVNLIGAMNLMQVMDEFNVRNIIFSSSATVYGTPEKLPIPEDHPVGNCTNPYGMTKFMIEKFLMDQCKAKPDFNAVILRYFNPVGAHSSGRIGEDPRGAPNNLMPYITQVAIGRRPFLSVFGSDYDTTDGTGVRDYIHVVDLANGHVAALKLFEREKPVGCAVYNLGTGQGCSVLEMVTAMREASKVEIAYKVVDRRAGDVASVYGDPSKAAEELGFKATKTLKDMCEDSWRWQQQNPQGFNCS